MNNLPAVKSKTGYLVANTLQEARDVIGIISESSLVPKSYIDKNNKPKVNDMIIAGNLGKKYGWDIFESLQAICVINGRPSVWGTYFWALVLASPKYERHQEIYHDDIEGGQWEVKVWKKGEEDPIIVKYSIQDATKAGLLSDPMKKHTWGKYPKDMALWKARNRIGNSGFADVICGLTMVEEAMDVIDIDYSDIKQKQLEKSKVKQLKADLQPKEGESPQSPQTGIEAPEICPEVQEENNIPESQPPDNSPSEEKKRKPRSDKGTKRGQSEPESNPVLGAIEKAWYGQDCDGLSVTFKTEIRNRLRMQGITFNEPKDLDGKDLESLYSEIENQGGFEDNPPF